MQPSISVTLCARKKNRQTILPTRLLHVGFVMLKNFLFWDAFGIVVPRETTYCHRLPSRYQVAVLYNSIVIVLSFQGKWAAAGIE